MVLDHVRDQLIVGHHGRRAIDGSTDVRKVVKFPLISRFKSR